MSSKFGIGDVCRTKKPTYPTLEVYLRMKVGMPYLMRPCDTKGMIVMIQAVIEPGNYIVQVQGVEGLKLSCFNEVDLTKCS